MRAGTGTGSTQTGGEILEVITETCQCVCESIFTLHLPPCHAASLSLSLRLKCRGTPELFRLHSSVHRRLMLTDMDARPQRTHAHNLT